MQKTRKITETLASGYSSESTRQELSNEYQDDRVSVIFRESCILVLWTKVVSAFEGLTERYLHSCGPGHLGAQGVKIGKKNPDGSFVQLKSKSRFSH